MNKTCDIFISYRCSSGCEIAIMLHNEFEYLGYKVLIDSESLDIGMFDEQLCRQIDNCKDIIVVVLPNIQSGSENENSCLLQEIAYAITTNKDIVPLSLDNYQFPNVAFPVGVDNLMNYEGSEISPKWFNTFSKKQQKMLRSKRSIQDIIIKQIITIILPLIILANTFLFIHNYKKEKEIKQLEQVTTVIVSEISAGFVNSNQLIGAIQDVNLTWKEFHFNLLKTTDYNEKANQKSELSKYIDFKLYEISETTKIPNIQLTAAHEELLMKNEISIQKIKDVEVMIIDDVEQTQDYLLHIKAWINTPEIEWPSQLDEGLDKLAAITIVKINGDIYAFNELIIDMPPKSQMLFNKFRPMMTKYTVQVDYQSTKDSLDAKQGASKIICKELLDDYSRIVGRKKIKPKVIY